MSGRSGRQVIPRPPDSRPGGPAPWALLAPEQRRVDAGVLRKAFTGRVGQPVGAEFVDAALPPAAVLAAFYEVGPNDLEVVLTRRSMALRNHTGEVSFPGGRSDPGEDPVTTALREAYEEIGLDPSEVEVLGELDQFMTLAGRSFIVPVVGLLARPPVLRPSVHEVDEILPVPVAHLLADGVFRAESWRFPVGSAWVRPGEAAAGGLVNRSIYFFELESDTVWGATARMLHHLFCLCLGLPDTTDRH